MGCPSEVEIGDNLVFSVTTHDPDTSVLTDADAVPTYRIYEDETATPILTGSMAKLDDANTTGFYTESIACTSGNGFENGKTYTVYIEATVDSDKGGMSYAFKAYDQRKANVTKWLDTAVTISATSAKPEVDAHSVSDDAGAADALELLVENAKGTDHKVLLSTDAQDLSGSLDVNAKTLAAGSITNAVIATGAIGADEIGSNAITAAKIASAALTAAKFGDNAIGASTIAANAIGASELAADAVNAIRDAILADSTAFNGANVDATISSRSTVTTAQVNAQVVAALAAIHLDHLLAVDTPAPLPGTAGSILHDLLQDDAGVWRYIANALEEAPGGSGEESRSHTGTAQAGTSSTITLAAGASSLDNIYKHGICFIHTGTGAGEFQIIDSYVGSTRVATMAANWVIAPDNTSQYRVLPLGTIPGASAPTAAEVAAAVLAKLIADHKATSGSLANVMNEIHCNAAPKRRELDKTTQQTTTYDRDGTTPLFVEEVTAVDDDTVKIART